MSYYLHQETASHIEKLIKNPTHGYIFSGPRYLFKNTVALDIAHQLTGGIGHFESPNIILVEGEDGKALKLDRVRQLREQLNLTAYDANHPRVVLIHEAETMSHEAANALLKTLEEPHDNVVFILTVNRLSALPSTIRSRMQVVRFLMPNEADLRNWLTERVKNGFNEEAITEIMVISGGLPRLARELIDDTAAHTTASRLREQATSFMHGDLITRFGIAQEITKQGKQLLFLAHLQHMAAADLLKAGNAYVAEMLIDARRCIDANVAPRLVLENLCLELEP